MAGTINYTMEINILLPELEYKLSHLNTKKAGRRDKIYNKVISHVLPALHPSQPLQPPRLLLSGNGPWRA